MKVSKKSTKRFVPQDCESSEVHRLHLKAHSLRIFLQDVSAIFKIHDIFHVGHPCEWILIFDDFQQLHAKFISWHHKNVITAHITHVKQSTSSAKPLKVDWVPKVSSRRLLSKLFQSLVHICWLYLLGTFNGLYLRW